MCASSKRVSRRRRGRGERHRARSAAHRATRRITTPPWPQPRLPARPPAPDNRDQQQPAERHSHERDPGRDGEAAALLSDPGERSGELGRPAAHVERDLPVEDLRALALVLDLGWHRVRHPVDAMVVPGKAPRTVDRLPVRRGLRGGVRGNAYAFGVAVVVEVVARRTMVDGHGPVGGDPHIRLAAVALHDHGLSAAVLQLDAVVVVDDLRVNSTLGRGERPHRGTEVRITLMRQRSRNSHTEQGGRNNDRSPQTEHETPLARTNERSERDPARSSA